MNVHLFRFSMRRVALPMGVALLVAACSGGGRDGGTQETGGRSGVSRQFDEYPATLSIEGPTIVESGATVTLQARADNNEYRGPAYLTYTAAQTLRVRTSPEGIVTPTSVLLNVDQRDRNFLSTAFEATGPIVTEPTLFSVSVDNPRASAQRTLTVVPTGILFIRRMLLSQPIVESGQTIAIEIQLSQPAPAATAVQLAGRFLLLDLPTSVTIPANARSVVVNVRANELLTGQEYETVSATLNGLSQQASLWVRSANAFVLKIELERHYYARTGTVNGAGRYKVPVRLSKPAGATGLTIALTSNNTFATVPATIFAAPGVDVVEFPLEVAAFVGLSAVRITASGGGTTRIGDALLGRDEGTPVIESLTLHRLVGDGRGGFIEGGPCFDSNNRSHGIRIFGRANIVLDRIAPAGGFRVNLFARSSVLVLQQEFSIPAGEKALRFDFDIATGTASAQLRFVKVTVRAVDTLQERSDTLLVGEGGGSDLAELTSGAGSLGESRNFIPYFDWDPQPTAGGVLRGRVTLGEVDSNGNFVEAHTHGSDDVPVYLNLTDPAILPSQLGHRIAATTLTVPALLGYADFELPLPPGMARQLSLRADVYSPDRNWMATGGVCDLSYVRMIDIGQGGTLAFANATPRYVFGSEGGTVNVTLSEPAPTAGAIVELTSSVPSSLLTLPERVIVPAGALTASVPFSTGMVTGFIAIDIVARYGNSTIARVELMPEPDPLVLRFDPVTLNYGTSANLRLELSRRYPVPLVASLLADASSAALLSVPSTVVVPARQLEVSVPIPVVAIGSGVSGGQVPVGVRATVRATSTEARAEIASVFSWYDIGSPISIAGVTQAPSLSTHFYPVDGFTRLLIAFIDTLPGDAGRLVVRERDSADWRFVGSGPLNPVGITTASQPFVLFQSGDGSSVPEPLILAFTQGNGVVQNVFVVRFDATAGGWRDLSNTQSRLNTNLGSSRAVQPTLTTLGLDEFGRLRTGLAFVEDGAVQFLWFDGTAWHTASPPTALAGSARDVQFLNSNDGIARLVWVDEGDAAFPIKGAELDLRGGGWTSLPPLDVPLAQPGMSRLDFFAASEYTGMIAWSQSTLPAHVLSAHFDRRNRRWIAQPADSPSDPNANLTALTLTRNTGFGTTSLVYATDAGAGGRTVWVRRLDNSNWVNAVAPDTGTERVVGLSAMYFLGLAVASVRQSDDGTQHTLRVRTIASPLLP